MNDLQKRAKEIITKIFYITIATATKDGKPWNSPVYSAYDENYNFFWVSDKNGQHSKNIAENNNIFLVIYDSTASANAGYGVYIQAIADEITDVIEIEKAYALLTKRAENFPWKLEELKEQTSIRVYKATPKKVWMNGEGNVNGNYIDIRTEIHLTK